METNQSKQFLTFRDLNRLKKHSDGSFTFYNRDKTHLLLVQHQADATALLTYAENGRIIFTTRQNVKQPLVIVLAKLETMANLSN